MERLFFTYALVKSLHDQGYDYVGSFLPFVLKVLSPKVFTEISFIQRNLKAKFNLDIPQHVLLTILNRAKRNYYIKEHEKQYSLTDKAIKYLDTFETDKQVEQRIGSLFSDMVDFFHKEKVSLDSNRIQDLVFRFLRKNTYPLIELINPTALLNNLAIERPDPNEKILIQYIAQVEKDKPDLYRILQDMLMGSVISIILYTKNQDQIEELRAKFSQCKIFLDTNFTFFILDLFTPEFNEPAKELFLLLKKYKFDIRIFSFTIDEICRVMIGYTRESYRYPTTIEINGLYSNLKIRGWDKIKVMEFISNVYEILEEKGIKIEWVKNIDIKNYVPKNNKLGEIITRCKPHQGSLSHNHDIAAIERIKEFRDTPIRKIEFAKALFLTADVRLSSCNFREMGHKEDGTVCEVILDRVLTNILWLKNPESELSLKSIIAIHSRDLFIKRSVWDRFYDVLQYLKHDKKISDENISMLFYHDHIENVLMEFNEFDVIKITPNLIIEEAEKALKLFKENEIRAIEKSKDSETKLLLERKEKDFIVELGKEINRKDSEKQQALLEQKQFIEGNLRASAEKEANVYSYIVVSICFLVLFCVIFWVIDKLYVQFERLQKIALLQIEVNTILTLIVGVGLFKFLFKISKDSLQNKLASVIYRKKIKDARL